MLKEVAIPSLGCLLMAFVAAACGGESSSDAARGGTPGMGGAPNSGGSSTTGGSGGSIATDAGGCADPAALICADAGDCELRMQNCCVCGTPEIGDYVAVNRSASCGCPGPACFCAIATNPNLGASCESGVCRAWDIRQRSDLSSCQTEADCRLRIGLNCCEPCLGAEHELVAINLKSQDELKALMCVGAETCSKCLAQYPPNKTAKCVSNTCQVVDR